MLKPLRLTVEQVDNQEIIARLPDGTSLTLPLESVYGTPKPGQEIRLIGVVPGSEDAGTTEFAQALLNEFLT